MRAQGPRKIWTVTAERRLGFKGSLVFRGLPNASICSPVHWATTGRPSRMYTSAASAGVGSRPSTRAGRRAAPPHHRAPAMARAVAQQPAWVLAWLRPEARCRCYQAFRCPFLLFGWPVRASAPPAVRRTGLVAGHGIAPWRADAVYREGSRVQGTSPGQKCESTARSGGKRRARESDPPARFCRPSPGRSATPPKK